MPPRTDEKHNSQTSFTLFDKEVKGKGSNYILISSFTILTLSRPDDNSAIIQNPSPSRPDDDSAVIQKKFISKNHKELVSAK